MTPMLCLNSSHTGKGNVAICLQLEAGRVGASCRWRAGGALEMEVSLITGGCSNVGITYTRGGLAKGAKQGEMRHVYMQMYILYVQWNDWKLNDTSYRVYDNNNQNECC